MSVGRTGNHDRAWNDPPQFSYANGGVGRPRTQLNKRVAYVPVGVNTTDAKQSTPSAQVSTPVPIPFPEIPLNGAVTPTNINVFTPPDFHRPNATPPTGSPPNLIGGKVDITNVPDMAPNEMLLEVESMILEKLDQIKPGLGGRKLEDINRRLGVMRQQWNDGHLSEVTRKRMYLLSQRMAACDFDEAIQIQVSLIVDYSCEVSQWIVGVKHIILECQAQHVRK